MNRRDDTLHMNRCFELARRGSATVGPNPMVGCVIVRYGRVVGEGYHRRFGGPHAEVYALRAAGARAKGATLYVNLEPCSHFGKTPPCADSIIEAGVAEVVIASQDPNPLVRGRGIRNLRAAGIRVRKDLLRTEAERLNERFLVAMKRGTPFVGVKLAMTLDGRIADKDGSSKWITGLEARALAHELRSEYDAVLVGTETALQDDPELTVRHVQGRNPVRVVLDGSFRLPTTLKLFDTDDAQTVFVTTRAAAQAHERELLRLVSRRIRVVILPGEPKISMADLLRELHAGGINSLLVEGGAATAGQFIEERLVDRLHLFLAPKLLGEGMSGIAFANAAGMKKPVVLQDVEVRPAGPDMYITARVAPTPVRKRKNR